MSVIDIDVASASLKFQSLPPATSIIDIDVASSIEVPHRQELQSFLRLELAAG